MKNNKDSFIIIRVTKEEKEIVKQKAKEVLLPLSKYVRNILELVIWNTQK